MATPSPMEGSSGGISRSGRVRKKSAKVIEMEELDKVDTIGLEKSTPKSSKTLPFSANGIDDPNKPLRKKLKIKLSPSGNAVVEKSGNDYNEDHINEVIPSLKIKLFPDSSGTEVGRISSMIVSPKKKGKSPIKVVNADENKTTPTKAVKTPKKNENDTPANKLFQQITSGLPTIDRRRKHFRKINPEVIGNVDFGSENECDSDEQSLVIATDTKDCVAAAMAQANRVKNPKIPKTSIEKRDEKKAKQKSKSGIKTSPIDGKGKKKRTSSITAYTLFARENRSKISSSCPELDFANVSRRLGEIWQALPAKEKMQWKMKAQKMSSQSNEPQSPVKPMSRISRQNSSGINSHQNKVNYNDFSKYPSSNDKPRVNGTGYIDAASHLRLLGESLSNIGQKLTENPSIPVSGSLSLILDSTLCAIGPLLCLTSLDEQTNVIPKEVHEKILDNVSYIMPGV